MIYTIGHSNLTIDDFLTLIEPISTIIDIRSHPGSVHPQFRYENISKWLPQTGKCYELNLHLGGWRTVHLPLAPQFETHGVDIAAYAHQKFPKQRIARDNPSTTTPTWTNQGLYDYSWYMSLDEFISAASELIQRSHTEDIAIMCCESLWWKCHRSMVSDYIVWAGNDAIHLQPKTTNHSAVLGNRLQRYDKRIINSWQEHGINTMSKKS